MNKHPNAPGHRALRKGRVSIPGQIYLLTTTTQRRTPLFASPALAWPTCRCIHTATNWGDANLLCWVLMPDHWHGLLQLGESGNLSKIMNCWKAAVSRALHRGRHEGPVWARGFHDHALRHDEGVRDAARYIVANPLRAGLVESVRHYPYWNSVWLTPMDAPQRVNKRVGAHSCAKRARRA